MKSLTHFSSCILALVLLAVVPVSASVFAQASDFVVATHYPQFGGTEAAPRDEVTVEYTVYNNRENDYTAVDAATAESVLTKIQQTTGLKVVMLNDWSEVQEDSDTLQIVNNVPIEGALYTITLPVGWNKSKKLPVALSGNGAGISNNRRLYTGGEIDLPVLVGFSTLLGGSGFIGAMSNCGGTESQGIDEVTYRSVGAFFDFIDQNGGDKHNAMTAGWSRGGGTALMWAINPLKLDYTVNIVFAGVPPTHYGTLSQLSVLTYPSLANIATLVGQDDNAWNYDNEGVHPGLNPSPVMEKLIGTGDPAEADALSPIGMAEGLKGKQVLIEFGSHDAFFPLAPFLEFDRKLTELGVDHATVVTLNSGHEDGAFARGEVIKALTALVTGQTYAVPQGRHYFIDINPGEDKEIALAEFYDAQGITADPAELPVTVRLPYRAGVGNPVDIEVCGTPGTTFSLSMYPADEATTDALYTFAGTLDEAECLTDTASFTGDPQWYQWLLSVDETEVDQYNTISFYTGGDQTGCHQVAATEITEDQPEPAAGYPVQRTLGWGLLQYAPPALRDDCAYP